MAALNLISEQLSPSAEQSANVPGRSVAMEHDHWRARNLELFFSSPSYYMRNEEAATIQMRD
jgi:hypothetical protein